MGDANLKSVTISTVFGASSSCSFAALSAARSLVLKGAHFITAVAVMFASTNLVIELGILIMIFLGWQFLAGEIVGGLLLIAISSILIQLTYPKAWLQRAREKVEEEAPDEEEDFDWRKRIKSREGWQLVGHQFVMEWQMVWEEVLIGFTIAGFMAVFVPQTWWVKIFLIESADTLPHWLILLTNLHRRHVADKDGHKRENGTTLTLKRIIVYLFIAVLIGGVVDFAVGTIFG